MTRETAIGIAAKALYKPDVKFDRDSIFAKRIDRDPTNVYWIVDLPIPDAPDGFEPNSVLVQVNESDGSVLISKIL